MKWQIFRRPLYVDKPYLEIVFDESGKMFDYRIWKCLQSGKRDWFDVMDLERKRRGWKSGLIGHLLSIWCASSLIWHTRICLVLRLIQYRKDLENTHDAKTALMGWIIKAVWFLSPIRGASLPTCSLVGRFRNESLNPRLVGQVFRRTGAASGFCIGLNPRLVGQVFRRGTHKTLRYYPFVLIPD